MDPVESLEDVGSGIVRYRLSDGRIISLDENKVRRDGVAEVLREMGYGDYVPTKRLDVYQNGQKIGSVPPHFDPSVSRTRAWLAESLPGDFRREGDIWVASQAIGPMDFDAIPGFKRA